MNTPNKNKTNNSNNKNTKNTVKKQEMNPMILKSIIGGLGFIVLVAGGYFTYEALKPKEQPNWLVLDGQLDTGQILKHVEATSYITRDSDNPMINRENDQMTIAIKKIEAIESILLTSPSADFLCVTNNQKQCSVDIVFDNKTQKSYKYEGGDNKTAFIVKEQVPDFIQMLKQSKEVKVRSYFSFVSQDADEKLNRASNRLGPNSNKIQKEYTIKVEGLQWS